jgi:hypothetical protein
MVVISIVGNDFEFGNVVRACAGAYLAYLPPLKTKTCEMSQKAKFEGAVLKTHQEAVEKAINRVGKAMENAGYAKGEYTIVVQDYPSPIPNQLSFAIPKMNDG